MALTGNMVAPENQHCWLVCKLTSQAQFKDTTLKALKLQLNPEVAEFVEIVDSIGCGHESDLDEEEQLCIEPGETYEVLFKLRISQVRLAKSFIEDSQDGGLNLTGLPNMGSKSNDMKDTDASVPDQVSLLKKLYTLQQMELFAELHFEWTSFLPRDEENLIQLGGQDDEEVPPRKTSGYQIPCCVGSPPINFVSQPLKVRVRNEREIQTVKLYEPFTVEYEVLNLTQNVIFAISEMQTYQDGGPTKAPFMVAGEIKSRLHLMPSDEGYILRYTLFPQQLGQVPLPRLSISDV